MPKMTKIIKLSVIGSITYFVIKNIYELGSKNIKNNNIKWSGFNSQPTKQIYIKPDTGESPELRRVWIIDDQSINTKISNEGQQPTV